VTWVRLGGNIYIAYNFSQFAIYLPKLIKIRGTLTKFWQETKMHSFLRHGVDDWKLSAKMLLTDSLCYVTSCVLLCWQLSTTLPCCMCAKFCIILLLFKFLTNGEWWFSYISTFSGFTTITGNCSAQMYHTDARQIGEIAVGMSDP